MCIIQPNIEWIELGVFSSQALCPSVIIVVPFRIVSAAGKKGDDDHLQECCPDPFTQKSTYQTLLLWLWFIQSTALDPGESSRTEEATISLLIPKLRNIDGDEGEISWSLNDYNYGSISKTHLLKRQVYRRETHTYKVVDKQNVRLCYYIFIKWVPTCCGETSNWRGPSSCRSPAQAVTAAQHLEPLDAPREHVVKCILLIYLIKAILAHYSSYYHW